MRLPANQWVEILNDAKDEFEVNGGSAVFSTWRMEEDDPLDICHRDCRRHACQSRQVGPERLDDGRLGYPTSCSSPRGQFYSEIQVSPMMIGSLKTSLIQSRLSERRARGKSRSLGTQSLAC